MNTERNGTVSGSALPARRDYKDTIFRRLFQDRENLLSLYNAVNRTDSVKIFSQKSNSVVW